MFKIYDGREYFFQWDLDRKLVVEDKTINKVYFCNRLGNCSIMRCVYEVEGIRLVDVPNLILQDSFRMYVYGYDTNYTKHSDTFEIKARTKPEDYFYTDEEIKLWDEVVNELGAVKEELDGKVNKHQGENYVGSVLYTNYEGDIDYLTIGDTFEIKEVPKKNIFYGEWKNGQFWQGAWQPVNTGMRNASVNQLFPVNAGGTYTASGYFEAKEDYAGTIFYLAQFDKNKNFLSFVRTQNKLSNILPVTMTLSEDTAFIGVQIYTPGEAEWTELVPIDFMIEEGSLATEYEPFSPVAKLNNNMEAINNIEYELSMVEGKTKNLNVLPYVSKMVAGVTLAVNEDNSINLAGTSTAVCYAFDNLAQDTERRFLLPAGTYTLSGTIAGAARCYACLYEMDAPTTLAGTHSDDTGAGVTFTTYKDYLCAVQIAIYAGRNVDGYTIYPQLEVGTMKTLYVTPFGKTSGRLDAIERNMNDLKGEVGAFDVPSYYFENNYLPDRIDAVREKMLECAGHGDAFVFITDAHWTQNAKNSPALINYISKHLNINKVICGGDMGDNDTYIEFNSLLRSAFKGRIFNTLGNHEYFYPNTGSILNYHLNMYNEDTHTDNAERNYYYYDNHSAKVRYIMLSAFTPALPDNIGAREGHEAEQVEWLTNKALNVEEGWSIVVCTHMIHYMNLTTLELTAPNTGGKAVLDALDAYNANENSRGKVVCILQGHTHHDRITRTSGGIPIIITACDKYLPWMDGETNKEPWLATRKAGTITEQAFDIVVINKQEKEIYLYRIGGDAFDGIDDNAGSPVNMRVAGW